MQPAHADPPGSAEPQQAVHRVIAAQAHLLEAIGDPRAPAVYQQAAGRARHPSEVRYLRYRASTIDTEGSGPPQ